MQEPRSWRDLLRRLIERPEEKRALSERSSIEQRTLERWASGATKEPQRHALHALVDAVPMQREQMIALIQKEFPDFDAPRLALDTAMQHIPSEFYARVLNAHAATAEPLHFWTLSNLVSQQAASLIDTEQQGLLITIAQCTPPRDGRVVQSLYVCAAWGRYPWEAGFQPRGYYLGRESLAGYVVAACQPAMIQDTDEEALLYPLKRVPHERSSVAYPLQRAGQVAGSVVFSSPHAHFFTPAKQRLGQGFAELLSLAFERETMYNQSQIYLENVPPLERQLPLLATVTQAMLHVQEEQRVSQSEAERIVRQDIEARLLVRERQEHETDQPER